MAIRLVAMDLDDTLLRDDWTISPRVVNAVQKAGEQGVTVTIATGRMPISARPYAQQLGINVPVITYHGAMVQEALSGEILFRRVIPSPLAWEIVEDVQSRGFYCQIFLKDRVLTGKLNELSERYARISSIYLEEADLKETLAQEPEGVEKILLMADEHHAAMRRLDVSSRVAGELDDVRGVLESRVAAAEGKAADALEAAAKKVEDIAARLADA